MTESMLDDAAGAPVMYCTNHPDTETLLRCNKCGKPICLKCAVLTEVGYRCKECIREQQNVFYNAMTGDNWIAFAVAASVFSGAAWAVDPFTVRDIRIEGLQRVEAGTIFASLPVRIGDTYDDQKGAAAIQSIFALGLFKDVRIEALGDVLVVIVEERPTVAHED